MKVNSENLPPHTDEKIEAREQWVPRVLTARWR